MATATLVRTGLPQQRPSSRGQRRQDRVKGRSSTTAPGKQPPHRRRNAGRRSIGNAKAAGAVLAVPRLPGAQALGHVPLNIRPDPVDVRPEPQLDVSLPKLLLASGYFVGAALVVICMLDLLVGVPFSRANVVFDAGFLFSGLVLLYLSWNARDGLPNRRPKTAASM